MARRVPELPSRLRREERDAIQEVLAPLVEGRAPRPRPEYATRSKSLTLRDHVLGGLTWEEDTLPPAPERDDPGIEFFREVLRKDGHDRQAALRAALADARPELRTAAAYSAALLDVPGLEEEMFASSVGDPALEYLTPRKTPELLERVRRRVDGGDHGFPAKLWVRWEGRTAAEALLEVVRGQPWASRSEIEALSEAPLLAGDAETLLAMPEELGTGAQTQALARTGTREALARVAQHAARSGSSWERSQALRALLSREETRPTALRIISTLPRNGLIAACDLLQDLPGRDAVPFLLPLLDDLGQQGYGVGPRACAALARCDAEAARAAARERLAAGHVRRRLVALHLYLELGEEPPPEALEVFRDATELPMEELDFVVRLGTLGTLRALLPLLQSSQAWIGQAAWRTLAAATGQAPSGAPNDLFLPIEARAAWEAWIDAHRGTTRRDWIEEALVQGGFGAGEEGRLRAIVEGPWYLAHALHPIHGQRVMWPQFVPNSLHEMWRWRSTGR